MIDYRQFGKKVIYAVHGRPCLVSEISKYDEPWRENRWRSTLSSRYDHTHDERAEFNFSTCLEKSTGKYTIFDCHSKQPLQSLIYFTVNENALEIRLDKQLACSCPVIHDQWEEWHIKVKFSVNGYVEIWRNGSIVVDQKSRTLYDRDDVAYCQIGVYEVDDWATGEEYRRMYFQI